ncbi:BatA domain-containing protein, partial [Lutimonas sp.]|uniref:BatA domain-containing protein n=1 Tax=Lutimonas sp. TaxID=1872403 RepID=UPI003C716697
MVFLNPLFLWTLLGLLVPVAIHFWSKKKVKTIKIGSTQLLRELNPKQTKSIRLNQWFLLLLRMMIITLIALILAVPGIEFLKKERSITYLIEPSLVGQEKVNTLLDTIADSQLRLLEPGFPILEDPKVKIDKAVIPDYWQLAQQMETLEADSIIVLTKGRMSGFKGMRPSVSLPVHWLVIDVDASAETPVEALLKNDQLVVKSIISDQNSVNYKDKTYTLDSDNILID